MIRCKTIDGRIVELHAIDYREQVALGHIAEGPKIDVVVPPEKEKTEHSIKTIKPAKGSGQEETKEPVDEKEREPEQEEAKASHTGGGISTGSVNNLDKPVEKKKITRSRVQTKKKESK